jgi:tRNA A-37 threonylcarbamoyl transferase component Bud32/membrane-associated phospholipid phosphatase
LGVALTVSLSFQPALAALSSADDTVLGWISAVRTPVLTEVAGAINGVGSPWTVRVVAWTTIVALLTFRRLRHLFVYLVVFLACSLVAAVVAREIGRMRPTGVTILSGWSGYSYPARPVAALAFVLVGALYTLVPAGPWRIRGKYLGAGLIAAVGLSQLYLAVDHPTDVLAAGVLGWVIPVVVFHLAAPDDAFPVNYRRGRRAHLDVGGARGQAIRAALNSQLGWHVVAVEPFGLAGSAGSTPLRIRVHQKTDGVETTVFGKLYALNHLRSDRWYKLTRTVLYGRLEDEKPFSTVRRLVEYEDHILRLLRDEGLPTPRPYGFVEITPEREYLVVMELFDGAAEISKSGMDDETIGDGLAVVRRLWDSGVAHRDIKPSNLLVRDGRVLLIDVAFATVRPTPWRQAVDLANMMLTLSLFSTPDRVYERALSFFTPDEIAEALAATRSITVPTQLRSRLRADGRDIIGDLRRLAPDRSPVVIQLWDLRRLFVTVAVLGVAALALAAMVMYLRTTSLL